MFKCGNCGLVTKPNEKAVRVVTQYRQHEHPPRKAANHFTVLRDGIPKKMVTDDPGGSGPQIVKEMMICQACAGNV